MRSSDRALVVPGWSLSFHGVCAVDSDAAGGSSVYLGGGASTFAGRVVCAGDQGDLAVGIVLAGSGGCNAEGRKCVGLEGHTQRIGAPTNRFVPWGSDLEEVQTGFSFESSLEEI